MPPSSRDGERRPSSEARGTSTGGGWFRLPGFALRSGGADAEEEGDGSEASASRARARSSICSAASRGSSTPRGAPSPPPIRRRPNRRRRRSSRRRRRRRGALVLDLGVGRGGGVAGERGGGRRGPASPPRACARTHFHRRASAPAAVDARHARGSTRRGRECGRRRRRRRRARRRRGACACTTRAIGSPHDAQAVIAEGGGDERRGQSGRRRLWSRSGPGARPRRPCARRSRASRGGRTRQARWAPSRRARSRPPRAAPWCAKPRGRARRRSFRTSDESSSIFLHMMPGAGWGPAGVGVTKTTFRGERCSASAPAVRGGERLPRLSPPYAVFSLANTDHVATSRSICAMPCSRPIAASKMTSAFLAAMRLGLSRLGGRDASVTSASALRGAEAPNSELLRRRIVLGSGRFSFASGMARVRSGRDGASRGSPRRSRHSSRNISPRQARSLVSLGTAGRLVHLRLEDGAEEREDEDEHRVGSFGVAKGSRGASPCVT